MPWDSTEQSCYAHVTEKDAERRVQLVEFHNPRDLFWWPGQDMDMQLNVQSRE